MTGPPEEATIVAQETLVLIREAHAALRMAVDALECEDENERASVWDAVLGGVDDVSVLTKLELWLETAFRWRCDRCGGFWQTAEEAAASTPCDVNHDPARGFVKQALASGGSGEAPASVMLWVCDNCGDLAECEPGDECEVCCEGTIQRVEYAPVRACSGEAPADRKQREFLERHEGRMGRVDVALAEARGEAPAGEEITLRRCPKCKKLTMSYECCYVKGPPLFPQMDDYTVTERVQGVFIEAGEAPAGLTLTEKERSVLGVLLRMQDPPATDDVREALESIEAKLAALRAPSSTEGEG